MAATLVVSQIVERRAEPIAPRADVRQIPSRAGDWILMDDRTDKLDPGVMAQIKADSFVNRWYADKSGRMIELLVVYRRYGRREFAHRPELCFPAAGFTITEKGKTTLDWAGQDVPAVSMVAQSAEGLRTNLSYFFASGKKTEEDFLRQQLLMAFERVIPNKNGWTFIRLQAPMLTGDEAARSAQQDFMRAFAPAIERIITTDSPAAATAARNEGLKSLATNNARPPDAL